MILFKREKEVEQKLNELLLTPDIDDATYEKKMSSIISLVQKDVKDFMKDIDKKIE